MAVTNVILGADKAGDLSRALALMVAGETIAVAHVYHDDDCPCASGERSMVACSCDEVSVEVEVVG